jgi:KaiC/GvpD/RAD55 family RecA-like ATPase
MSQEQIIRDCRDIGWLDFEKHIEEKNFKIIHIFGEDLTFPSLDLADMIRSSIPEDSKRIIIDPLTYPTFYLEKERRKSLSTIFQDLRKLGTCVIVLEEPGNGDQVPNGAIMPLYLADTVIQLQNLGYGEMYDRTLRILKHRGSKHGEGLYPYSIETGLGIVLDATEKQIEKVRPKTKYDAKFTEAVKTAKSMGEIGEQLSARIKILQRNWIRDEDPSRILEMVLKEESKEYGTN